MNVQPFSNNVFFKFVDDTTNTRFANASGGGILIASTSAVQAEIPRWGKVTHVGPDVQDVSINEYILIEQGMWTSGFKVKGEKFWKTDETKILAAADKPGVSYF